MAHHDIFRHQLAIHFPAYGHALWEPGGGPVPVKVGDVGFIREGRFHRLFNILLPAEDSSHTKNGVPEYHEKLTPRMEDHIIPSRLGPNNLCSARVISQPVPKQMADGPAEVAYSCRRKQGAVLSFPTDAKSESTIALGDFGEWMTKNIDSWLPWVRRLGVGIDRMEDIVLVTGTHHTRSWTNVAFPGGHVHGLVSFGSNVATLGEVVTINWKLSHEYTRGAVMHSGPSGKDLPEDQCIFIRGFRVARKFIILPRALKAAAEPNPDPKGDDCEPDVELVPIQAVPKYRDPLHTILEYVAEAAPNCDMALVHDDDLAQFSAIGDDTSLETLEPDAFFYHLQCIKPIVHEVMLGQDLSSRSSKSAEAKSFRIATLSTIFEGRSVHLDTEEEASTWGLTGKSETDKSGAATKSNPAAKDPSCPVKGMYRLLDLITEQGSNGLVDKIIVAQESFGAFINSLSPGAYFSITKVNFKQLDDLLVKPVGVYGSKEEMVRFLRDVGAVDVETARKLLVPERDYLARGANPVLRSGLYVMRTFTPTIEEQVYVLYWPGDTTWNDDAVSTVEHTRVTFMRYLTKLCDQLVCLLSAKHSRAIVLWREAEVDSADDVSLDSECDDADRLFDFTVAKRNENDEDITARQGFTIKSSLLSTQPSPTLTNTFLSTLTPRLLYGETTQGFMTTHCWPARATIEPFSYDNKSARQIRRLLKDGIVLCLSENLDDKALRTLMHTMELGTRFPNEYEAWEQRRVEIEKRFQKTVKQQQEKSHETFQKEFGDLESKVREAAIDEILKAFPSLRRDGFPHGSTSAAPVNSIPVASGGTAGTLYDVFSIYQGANTTFLDAMSPENIDNGIKGTDFHSKKERLLTLLHLLDYYPNLTTQQIRSLSGAVLDNKDNKFALKLLKSFSKGEKTDRHSVFWRGKDRVLSEEEAMWKNANDYALSLSYSRFLSYVAQFPAAHYLHDAVVKSEEAAYTCLRTYLDSQVAAISQKILPIRKEEREEQVRREVENEEQEELKASRLEFVRKIEDLCRERSESRNSIHIDEFRTKSEHVMAKASYIISGKKEIMQDQEIEYTMHILRVQADEKHSQQLDPSYVPTPVLNERLTQSFHIPSETVVKYAHLLEGDRILLCLVDSQGNFMILLEHLSSIDGAIQSRSYSKFFHKDKIGEICLFAFDESTRLLAVYASARMQLHMFQFDEELKYLREVGAQIDLRPFYNLGVSIVHTCFVHENEEILFVDSSAQAKIFSLITLQPKPASLQLPQVPSAIYSAPDGSCLLVVQDADGERTLTAHHWSTFATVPGITVTLPEFPIDLDTALLTSIDNRNNVHLIGLSLATQSCRSVVLDITGKATEFSYQEQRSEGSPRHGKQTAHNCLIECHKDVWTRFPVVAAIRRQSMASSHQRQNKTLVFVTDDHRRPFSSHFSDMVSAFKNSSCKPTIEELKSIMVSALPFHSWTQPFLSNSDRPVSCFRAGEWLVDLLCLIPIHLADTQQDRFVPLKDGVMSPQLEKSLLGADVNEIVDSLTLGWYESIFQSYWNSKPVKVVSSMGEQSVGKSFVLNHLVDTSFAGSAMRTAAGVWMSVSPTDDALIVALDVEGVHSLERSAQEDTLLVLFTTAISNLVLFCNNLALCRDISGLFQSFRASLSVFDPASNPSLFRSTLVVIIKDVVNTDTDDVREFALKLQKLDEKEAHFITRLHAGRLQIIPWPVIESEEFYELFADVARTLDEQETSHHTTGEFLLTLKTLMAKLKANDWGTMSQTMAAYRANSLLEILPVALQTGYSKVFPELEPLKNFDTDIVIEAEDTEARFLLSGPDTPAAVREHYHSILIESSDLSGTRQQVDESEWISDLGEHLTRLVDLRVAHVKEWLKLNTQRFQAEVASMEALRRAFDSAVIDLRASVRVQFCMSECADCHLLCIQNRFHESDHSCLTSHVCIHDCTFCDRQLLSNKTCRLVAGHKRDHVCHVDFHMLWATGQEFEEHPRMREGGETAELGLENTVAASCLGVSTK